MFWCRFGVHRWSRWTLLYGIRKQTRDCARCGKTEDQYC